jgi:hypothetical protein
MTTPYFQENLNALTAQNTMNMDEDMNDTMNDTMNDNSYESDVDIEDALTHLKDFSNEKQLSILKREIGHIMVHALVPSEGWYDERFEHINLYAHLGWSYLAQRFHRKDDYLHDTAMYIMRLADELMEDRGSKPNFHLVTYYNLIMNVQNIWNYYKQVYGSGDDTDMMDLIESMSFLMK